jgi:hypothetical protein
MRATVGPPGADPDDVRRYVRCASCGGGVALLEGAPAEAMERPCGWCGGAAGWFEVRLDGMFLRVSTWRAGRLAHKRLVPLDDLLVLLAALAAGGPS